MKSALIIGVGGQDGLYLAEYLLSLGYRVYGTTRRGLPFLDFTSIPAAGILYADVRDGLSLRAAIQKSWPDEIYNLAAQVFVPLSWECPAETFEINVGGLARLLRIVEEVKRDAHVYQASSSEMFGNSAGPCTELTPMNPTSPYGISKLAAHRLAGAYRKRGLYVVGGILHNHESPRRGPEMVTRKIAIAVAAWAAGGKDPLLIGNLDSRRDWSYAGDVVRAMHLMLQQPEPDDYVAGSGTSHSVKEFILEACRVAGLDPTIYPILKVDERFVRGATEIHHMHADNSKIKALGWSPRIGFKELVSMMVEAEIKVEEEVEAPVHEAT